MYTNRRFIFLKMKILKTKDLVTGMESLEEGEM
jgi:hypothetical protein